jgi:hypothetical protein
MKAVLDLEKLSVGEVEVVAVEVMVGKGVKTEVVKMVMMPGVVEVVAVKGVEAEVVKVVMMPGVARR